ncbi:MAG: HAD family hydrolase [Burkholderiales bacterium]|uniref:HAD family hydrolase n=1 Tax=Undibacterium umbellatum TaxID=2762300 RepID=UPI001D8F8C9E|nr:HAD family hydrolase [Burkholderiales bacterium]
MNIQTKVKGTIALDADGVLLDYHASYALAWQKAFGALPSIKDPLAYWPIDRWDVQKLIGYKLEQFRLCFDEEFWSTIPPLPGALEACILLKEAGYDLVCVSALKETYRLSRLQNIRDHGFPIDDVIATEHSDTSISPKAKALSDLKPVAFVDDYLPYFRGVPTRIHMALITREPNGTPNIGEELSNISSSHYDLLEFAKWWIHCPPDIK